MIRNLILFVIASVPIASGQSGTDGQPPKGKDAPPVVQPGGAAVLPLQFTGKAGEPILLTATANGPIRWVSKSAGLKFADVKTLPKALKDAHQTYACAISPGNYQFEVVTSTIAADGLPHEPAVGKVVVTE